MPFAMQEVITFLEEEKKRSQNRIRQCQIYLRQIQSDQEQKQEVCHVNELKENLEAIAVRAEEDFGSFLHLITILGRTRAKTTEQPTDVAKDALEEEDVSFLSLNSSVSPMPQTQLRVAGEELSERVPVDGDDFDPLSRGEEMLFEFKAADQHLVSSELPNGLRAEVVAETEEERQEQDDVVPEIVSAFSPPVTRGGRALAFGRGSSSSSSGSDYMARSLPVSVPRPKVPAEPEPKFPPEIDRDPIDGQDIHQSIQLIAKSLHTNTLGELPTKSSLFKNVE